MAPLKGVNSHNSLPKELHEAVPDLRGEKLLAHETVEGCTKAVAELMSRAPPGIAALQTSQTANRYEW